VVGPGHQTIYFAIPGTGVAAYAINPLTGALSFIANSATTSPTAVAIVADPAGQNLFVGHNDRAVFVNRLAIDPFGRYLWSASNWDTLVGVALDPSSDLPTPLPGGPFSLGGTLASVPVGPAVDRTGQYLYASDIGNNKIYLFHPAGRIPGESRRRGDAALLRRGDGHRLLSLSHCYTDFKSTRLRLRFGLGASPRQRLRRCHWGLQGFR
jgi:DNA-binding beta-propeller fold protein YncE